MIRLLRNLRGSILVEAALAFPILVLILFSIAEFGEAFTIKRRNAQVAGTAADLVAQMSCVMASDLQDIIKIGGTILAPYTYSGTIAGLRITSVVQNANNATVQWSYAMTPGTYSAASQGALYSLPANLISQNQTIIVAETSYKFTPQVGGFLVGGVTFTAQAYNYPRIAGSVAYKASC